MKFHRPDPAKAAAFAKRRPWEWACLSCNATGTGSSASHRCVDAADYRRDFWVSRLAYVFADLNREQRAEKIARPVSRQQLVEWFGAQWSVA